jgi:hypothetical protein
MQREQGSAGSKRVLRPVKRSPIQSNHDADNADNCPCCGPVLREFEEALAALSKRGAA